MKHILALLLLFSTAIGALAENLFVTQNGAGSANGADWNNAWAGGPSIVWGGGAGQAGAGDTVWFAGGNHSGVIVGASGTAGSKIYLKRARATNSECTSSAGWQASFDNQVGFGAFNGHVIDMNQHSYIVIDGQITNGIKVILFPLANPSIAAYGIRAHGNFNTYQYLRLEGPFQANSASAMYLGPPFGFTWQTNALVRYLHFTNWTQHIFLEKTPGAIIEYCDFDRTVGDSFFHSNVMYCNENDDVTIRYNLFHDIEVEGIYIPPFQSVADHFYIYGNVFRDALPGFAGRALEIFPWGAGGAAGPNIFFYNNTMVNLGIYIRAGDFPAGGGGPSTFRGAQIKNNIFWNPGGFSAGLSAGITHSHNWFNSAGGETFGEGGLGISGGVNGDPFISLINRDLHIGNTVSGILPANKGVNLGAPYNVDKDGVTRGVDGGWDIGAYEATGSAPATTNAPNFTVGPLVTNRTPWAAFVKWTTDIDATNRILWGTSTSPYANTNFDNTLTANAGFLLTNLTDNTLYNFQAISCNLGVCKTNPNLQFTSAIIYSNLAQIEAEGGVLQGTMSSNVGGWITDTAGVESITAGGKADYWFFVPTNAQYVFSNRVDAPHSGANSVWHRVDAAPTNDFHILDVTNFTVGFEVRPVIWRGEGNFTNPAIVPLVLSLPIGFHSMHVIGREPGVLIDWWQLAIQGGAPTQDITAPIITNVVASGIGATSATIGWTTDEVANSIVEYGLTTNYTHFATNTPLVTTHAVLLSGLLRTNLYNYRVSSYDGSGNFTNWTNLTFTTKQNRRLRLQ
jgi:hypothetical protein